MSANIPNEPPPSYATATGSSAASSSANTGASHQPNNYSSSLKVPGNSGQDEIPLAGRRSMEDETRKLPPGWVRTFDPTTKHQFFVDTTKDPPRSIWHHPYDDEEYLATLSAEERERLEEESLERAKNPSKTDIIAAHSEDEDAHAGGSTIPAELPPRPGNGKGKAPEKASFGRRFKDKMTGMTHEQRVEERRRIAEQERLEYETYVRIRQAMAEAAQTGKPVHVGKDSTGRDVYVEPPYNSGYTNPYGGRPGYGVPGYAGGYPGSVAYNPYGGASSYTTPNARYVRPVGPYNRPYGSGFGGAGSGLAVGAGLGLLLGTSLLI